MRPAGADGFGLPPLPPGGCARPHCPHPAVEGGFLCREHEDEQVFLLAEEARERFVAFRAAALAKSRESIPDPYAGLTLDDPRLLRLLSPETWKRNPRHAAARAARLIEEARSKGLLLIRGSLFSGAAALACAKLGSVLLEYETSDPQSEGAALGNQARYLSTGAVARARDGHPDANVEEVTLFEHAGFLVLDGLGQEGRPDRIKDLLGERLKEQAAIVVVTKLTADEAKHRYGDVGEALFELPVLDLALMVDSIPTEYAWARFDAPELPMRVGLVDPTTKRRITPQEHIAAARAAVEDALAGRRTTVVLAGVAGGGKTSLAVAAATEMVERDPALTVKFVDAYELQRAAEPRAFGGATSEDPLIGEARDAGVLVLDEAGAEKVLSNDQSIVAKVIHHRHKLDRVTFITTPKGALFLKRIYGDGIYRRIADRSRTSFIKIGETEPYPPKEARR